MFDRASCLADLRRHGRMDTAREIESRFGTGFYEDVLADLDLEVVPGMPFSNGVIGSSRDASRER